MPKKIRIKVRQKLRLIILMFCGFLLITILIYSQEIKPIQISYNQKTFNLYPGTLDILPDIPSPFTTKDGKEIVVGFTKNEKFALVLVTVENGAPYWYNSNFGKGKQLEVDTIDFPTLAETGLHSEIELDQTRTITDKSISEITYLGRPTRSSGAGFMGNDEDIISVLKGDNRLVENMGLIHPQMAKPLFHVWNLILKDYELGNISGQYGGNIKYFLYNGKKILVEAHGTRGFQESIFNDEIRGNFQMNIRRELDEHEKEFLNKKYSNLKPEQMEELVKKLSYFHTGEMVPYYVMRYGFYEGHTDYRADPIAISFVFGLKSLEEIETAFNGNLYETLTHHFTAQSQSQNTQNYRHPSLGFQFTASKNWVRFPRPEDILIYEMMSPDSAIHVMLWYTETEQNGSAYLEKMAGMKDLIVDDKPSHRQINNLDAWVLNVPGFERRTSVRTLLAVIPHGKSQIRPKENRLFIIQIWCQKEKYPKHKSIMENILNSIKITE